MSLRTHQIGEPVRRYRSSLLLSKAAHAGLTFVVTTMIVILVSGIICNPVFAKVQSASSILAQSVELGRVPTTKVVEQGGASMVWTRPKLSLAAQIPAADQERQTKKLQQSAPTSSTRAKRPFQSESLSSVFEKIEPADLNLLFGIVVLVLATWVCWLLDRRTFGRNRPLYFGVIASK